MNKLLILQYFCVLAPTSFEKPVFGVPLSVAVDRNKCHDGIQLPALFRECLDYIEEHGKHQNFKS